MSRYFRCTSEGCRRKWHFTSMVIRHVVVPSKKGDLFAHIPDLPKNDAGHCPACGAVCEPDKGLMDEA